MTPSYPVLLIPPSLWDNRLSSLPAINIPRPVAPKEPAIPQPPAPLEPPPSPLPLWLPYFWVSLSVMAGGILSIADLTIGLAIGLGLLVIFGVVWVKCSLDIKKARGEYQRQKKRHQQQWHHYHQQRQIYQSRQAQWEQQHQQYLEELAQYNREVHRLEQESQPMRQHLRSILSWTKRPDGSSPNKSGISEAQFHQYLQVYFPQQILTGQTLTLYPGYPYIPDFIYHNVEWNLWIDIEIDEPYAYHSKEPTHCLGDEREEKRNRFFVESGWVVIRFAEEQVVRFPEQCCRFIAGVIYDIVAQPISPALAYTSLPPPITRWTEDEAYWMAQKEYRRQYL